MLYLFQKLCGLNCSLKELDDRSRDRPFADVRVQPATARVGYTEQTQFHNAAYDSFITGLVFARMAVHLGYHVTLTLLIFIPSVYSELYRLPCSCTAKEADAAAIETCRIQWPVLEVYKNKIAIPRVLDVQYLDMSSERDTVPER